MPLRPGGTGIRRICQNNARKLHLRCRAAGQRAPGGQTRPGAIQTAMAAKTIAISSFVIPQWRLPHAARDELPTPAMARPRIPTSGRTKSALYQASSATSRARVPESLTRPAITGKYT